MANAPYYTSNHLFILSCGGYLAQFLYYVNMKTSLFVLEI